MNDRYSYRASVKSDASDELINTYLLRPMAGVLVRFLHQTPVTPNHVTLAATLMGCVAAACYFQGEAWATACGGLCLSLKDLLDSADGQLARAKGMFSRAGRFLDSIGDIAVNALVFLAIGMALLRAGAGAAAPLLCVAAFLGMSLRVSYHVFYQASFLHLRNTYTGNRISEEIRDEDRTGDPFTLRLQKIFLLLYGWQDRFIARLDSWSRQGIADTEEFQRRWYGDLAAIRLSGFLGLGTELFLLMVFSLVNALDRYLWVNVVGMNMLWLGCILYRRLVVRGRLLATVS